MRHKFANLFVLLHLKPVDIFKHLTLGKKIHVFMYRVMGHLPSLLAQTSCNLIIAGNNNNKNNKLLLVLFPTVHVTQGAS